MAGTDPLARAHEAHRQQAWRTARDEFAAVDAQDGLEPAELDMFARAAYLCGDDETANGALARAHRGHVAAGNPAEAVRSAFWLGFMLANRGDMAQASGWLGRAARGLANLPDTAPEHGYLALPGALQALESGDPATALEGFEQARQVGEATGDVDLTAFGLLGSGQALVPLGRIDEGMAMLDEAMVSVTAGEVDPVVSGIVYCATIATCNDAWELRRVGEWTKALSDWCDRQPELVPYRGQCLVHRSEIFQLHGQWPDAMVEIERARKRFEDAPGQPAVGAAWYQQGELHRVRGDVQAADEAYGNASQWGHDPQPGLALLRLAAGKPQPAATAIRRVVDGADEPSARARVLPAMVDIMLAVDDVEAARAAADELVATAESWSMPYLEATAERAQGSVLLADGQPATALDHLRRAVHAWRDLQAPYEVACTQVLVARACRGLGDHDTAGVEAAAARRTAEELGAKPLLARIDALSATRPTTPGGLTSREVEVLAEVATGKTNRAIAETLFISEKTVARHLSNIFTKLDLSSRAAATAWAYEHDLV